MKKKIFSVLFFTVSFCFTEDVKQNIVEEYPVPEINIESVKHSESTLSQFNKKYKTSEKKQDLSFALKTFSIFVRENSVVINWECSDKGHNLIIYRSKKPFTSITSLIDAIPIANITDNGLPYLDYPIPGIPYYYAIAEENQLASGNIKFTDGKNTSSIPAEITADDKTFSTTKPNNLERPIPLPFLNITKEEKRKTDFFSSQTENIINALSSEKRIYKDIHLSMIKKEPYIFPDDKKSPSGGECMELQQILQDLFITNEWNKCERALYNFLKIRRTTRISMRTRFYLGEVYFFQKKYKEALLQFLTTQDIYPGQSKEWIQSCLLEIGSAEIK